MSDLHCPARVYVVVPDAGQAGAEAGAQVGERLLAAARAERVAAVLAAGPTGFAQALATGLGVPLELRSDLAGIRIAVDAPVPAALDAVADERLGEAVLVVGDAGRPGTLRMVRDSTGWVVTS
ncbi:hypothetical protein [Nocardioides donggukensis]|uniref:Uncharacterized protein n=1 Tax=Nocardioides donggukensis TaxID=2774019 RepID=A0A927K977_9ACTN|nr:hypothetical protein [Nocardioides donggukensis]MBD8870086.1 hypothetical protein [Nocardioides donggukensis]